jgi:hypothetical protein
MPDIEQRIRQLTPNIFDPSAIAVSHHVKRHSDDLLSVYTAERCRGALRVESDQACEEVFGDVQPLTVEVQVCRRRRESRRSGVELGEGARWGA